MQFFLVPTGTETAAHRGSIGLDRNGVSFFLDPVGGRSVLIGTAVDRGHGYSVTWSYPDAPLRAYVRVSAGNNLGHRSSTAMGLIHP